MLSLSECQDWCPFVKPNDTYKGLGIYRRFISTNQSDLLMFNRAGHQWKFDITSESDLPLEDMSLRMIVDSVENTTDENVVLRFGGLIKSLKGVLRHAIDCRLQELVVKCITSSGFSFQFKDTPLDHNWVAVSGAEGGVLFINKHNTSKGIFFNQTLYNYNSREYHQIDDCPSDHKDCVAPNFVNWMNASLFQKIDSVIDLFEGQKINRRLLLFNISGRPKYCLTYENQNISEEVRHLLSE